MNAKYHILILLFSQGLSFTSCNYEKMSFGKSLPGAGMNGSFEITRNTNTPYLKDLRRYHLNCIFLHPVHFVLTRSVFRDKMTIPKEDYGEYGWVVNPSPV